MVYYHSGKSNLEVDALSRILWDQNIRVESVEAIFKASVEGPDTLMETYACHKKAISILSLESAPVQMTVANWVQAQKGGSNYQPGGYLDRKQEVQYSESE